ncbi:MAG TPA: cadmium-translocating P-type ATPase [Syntrophomonadaceae bacterium]|nr:cadmium-translocating P-type ATPase [Syntrophomonadaceae bacterium]
MKYYVQGLDCAQCAARIEAEFHNTEGLQDTRLNFAAGVLHLDAKYEGIAQSIIDQIEPGVRLIPAEAERSIKESNLYQNVLLSPRVLRMGVALALLIIGVVWGEVLRRTPFQAGEYVVFITAYLLVGLPVIWRALKNISQGQVFDEYFLMTVATLGAFAIRAMPEAVAVMLFYAVGEYLQDLAVDRSRRSVSELINVRPDRARVWLEDQWIELPPEKVEIGQLILVQPGEKVPLDGVVLEGDSYVDTSAITGESLPRYVKSGDEVMAGVINGSGLLKVRVSRPFAASSVVKILELVENAAERKAPTEQFMTRFAAVYTPIVVIGAVLLAVLPPLIVSTASFEVWLYRALVLLVISCPCALVISIPLGYFGGIGAASRQGILIKGANYLDALTEVSTVVFDKTGTLTEGVFQVQDILPHPGRSAAEILHYAALAEIHTNHPIARSIREAYAQDLDASRVEDYQEIKGHGIEAKIDGRIVLAGNARLLQLKGIRIQEIPHHKTIVYVAIDGQYAGAILLADQVKEDARDSLQALKEMGIESNILLTGDRYASAVIAAEELGVDAFYAGLLPEDKVAQVEDLKRQLGSGQKLVFVGDGINDAPVLALSDIGVAMGDLGADAALEAADIILMDGQPQKIVQALEIAHFTRKIVMENVVLALGVKALVVVLAILGLATMWAAVFADVGVALLAVLNASRTLRYEGA